MPVSIIDVCSRHGRRIVYALHDSHVADLLDQAAFHLEVADPIVGLPLTLVTSRSRGIRGASSRRTSRATQFASSCDMSPARSTAGISKIASWRRPALETS